MQRALDVVEAARRVVGLARLVVGAAEDGVESLLVLVHTQIVVRVVRVAAKEGTHGARWEASAHDVRGVWIKLGLEERGPDDPRLPHQRRMRGDDEVVALDRLAIDDDGQGIVDHLQHLRLLGHEGAVAVDSAREAVEILERVKDGLVRIRHRRTPRDRS